MNFHPLFVHFPIALLTLYGVFELLRFKKLTDHPAWFYVKATFVIIGSVMTSAALLSGEAIITMFQGNSSKEAILSVHEQWGQIFTGFFAVIAFAYLILWVYRDMPSSYAEKHPRFKKMIESLLLFARFVTSSPVAPIMAFIGIAGLIVTGGLGGVLVHGVDVDPIASFVYRIFF